MNVMPYPLREMSVVICAHAARHGGVLMCTSLITQIFSALNLSPRLLSRSKIDNPTDKIKPLMTLTNPYLPHVALGNSQ
jgi:hypothetical protein